MGRQDQFHISASVTGIVNGSQTTIDLGTWDKHTGGEVDSEETKYKPGNMGQSIVIGGSVTVSNVVISKLYDGLVDQGRMAALMGMAGRGTMTVTKAPLDINGSPIGGVSPTVYHGILKTVTPPDVDSESSSAAMISLECSVSTVSS